MIRQHFWWCRHPSDYDGVCLTCGCDSWTGRHYSGKPWFLRIRFSKRSLRWLLWTLCFAAGWITAEITGFSLWLK